MDIEDTINTLRAIHQSIDQGIPQTITSPDALVAYTNDLYIRSFKNPEFDELFEYNEIGRPSLTITVSIDAEFNLERAVKGMRTRFQIAEPHQTDEIGNAGIVWSHGRYDFVYDENAELLRISHEYSQKRADTQSILTIIKTMIDHTLSYLKEVKAAAE
ncbi:hypothetical protein ACFL3F_01140 [Planctomycetota bacterium]